MSPLDPLYGVWALENHHDPSQRWPRREALLLFTDAAAHLQAENPRKGRLTPSYDADFAVYREDPLATDDVRGLLPEHTFVRGRLAHSA